MSRFYLMETRRRANSDDDEPPPPKIRKFRDLQNPVDGLSTQEVVRRFRFPPEINLELVEILKDDLDHTTRRSRAIPALHQVAIGLRYLATNSFQIVCGDLIFVDQATACRSIHRFLRALVKRVNSFITFPTVGQVDAIKDEFYELGNFPNVVGLVDGTHVRIIPPAANGEVYNNRKGYKSISVQCVCDHRGSFIHIYPEWPGSAHDSRLFKESNVAELVEALPGDNWLLGDSAYACSPVLLPAFRKEDLRGDRAKKKYNQAHKATRVLIESTYGRWKRRFSILHSEMRFKSPRMCSLAIVCCGMLHNLAIDRRLPDFDDRLEGRPYDQRQERGRDVDDGVQCQV